MTDLPPLTFGGALHRAALVPATEALLALVARPEVGAAWDEESSCEGMSVGALAWHLTNQPRRALEVLAASTAATGDAPAGGPGTEPVPLDVYYTQADWVRQDLDGPANVGVRTRSEHDAAGGQDGAVQAAADALGSLADALAAAPPTVLVPWQGAVLTTDDFLVTRLMEIVVHSDDLAASVGLPTPQFGGGVLEPVLALLSGLALRRHGQDALVRTLARPQRAPRAVPAF